MLLLDEVLKVQEKCGFSDILMSSIKKLQCKYSTLSTGSSSWLVTFELLCNWIKILPQNVFVELLESGWENIGHTSVRMGFKRIIQHADSKQSLLIAQNILSQISYIVKTFKGSGEQAIPSDPAVSFLKEFFDMDYMNGKDRTFIKYLAGGKILLKQVSEILHSLMIISALTPHFQSLISILDFCHCLIINKVQKTVKFLEICPLFNSDLQNDGNNICNRRV